MLEGIRQQQNEDDEAFLMRAERVMHLEQESIRERARMLVAVAVRAVDKPETLPGGRETPSRMLAASEPAYIKRRALLLARSLCREMQEASTGSDPVAQEAYHLLSRLALMALAPETSGPEPDSPPAGP